MPADPLRTLRPSATDKAVDRWSKRPWLDLVMGGALVVAHWMGVELGALVLVVDMGDGATQGFLLGVTAVIAGVVLVVAISGLLFYFQSNDALTFKLVKLDQSGLLKRTWLLGLRQPLLTCVVLVVAASLAGRPVQFQEIYGWTADAFTVATIFRSARTVWLFSRLLDLRTAEMQDAAGPVNRPPFRKPERV
jgi:hypothetical protein